MSSSHHWVPGSRVVWGPEYLGHGAGVFQLCGKERSGACRHLGGLAVSWGPAESKHRAGSYVTVRFSPFHSSQPSPPFFLGIMVKCECTQARVVIMELIFEA